MTAADINAPTSVGHAFTRLGGLHYIALIGESYVLFIRCAIDFAMMALIPGRPCVCLCVCAGLPARRRIQQREETAKCVLAVRMRLLAIINQLTAAI